MIKDIITYPTPPSVEYATEVRSFDENLNSLITDLKDTIIKSNIDGLTAYQIGSFYNVIVIKMNDDKFLELINPRLIFTKNKITTIEQTAYFPNLSAKVERFEHISIVYQDINGKDKTLKASGTLSILLQRKIDYTFGITFLNKLSNIEKDKFERKLQFGSDITIPESCPIKSYKNYILKFTNILLIILVLLFTCKIFITDNLLIQSIWNYQLTISYTILLSSFIYFFYGQYEGKKYSSCTSCQIGNLLGTTIILYIRLSLIMTLSYFL